MKRIGERKPPTTDPPTRRAVEIHGMCDVCDRAGSMISWNELLLCKECYHDVTIVPKPIPPLIHWITEGVKPNPADALRKT